MYVLLEAGPGCGPQGMEIFYADVKSLTSLDPCLWALGDAVAWSRAQK